jgi:hypothetical protein
VNVIVRRAVTLAAMTSIVAVVGPASMPIAWVVDDGEAIVFGRYSNAV